MCEHIKKGAGMLRKIDCVMIRVEDVSDPTAEAGHVTSMPNADQLPVSREAGTVSWELPKFGP